MRLINILLIIAGSITLTFVIFYLNIKFKDLKRRRKMLSSDTRLTGTTGITTWEAIHGKSTVSNLPEPKDFSTTATFSLTPDQVKELKEKSEEKKD